MATVKEERADEKIGRALMELLAASIALNDEHPVLAEDVRKVTRTLVGIAIVLHDVTNTPTEE